jgi:hypothetical protein
MPRPQKKYHYIYQTTCLATGKFYVGMHSTDDIDDGYLGSGKILGYSRKKYGDQNHKKEIVEMCFSREALKLREKEIVNEQMLADPLNINLKYGGEGGGRFYSPEQRTRASVAGNKSPKRGHAAITLKINATKKRNGYKPKFATTDGMLGKKHSVESKQQMSSSKTGEANNRFGTCWVTNGEKSVSIKKEQLDEYLAQGFRRGRIMRV